MLLYFRQSTTSPQYRTVVFRVNPKWLSLSFV